MNEDKADKNLAVLSRTSGTDGLPGLEHMLESLKEASDHEVDSSFTILAPRGCWLGKLSRVEMICVMTALRDRLAALKAAEEDGADQEAKP